MRSQINTGVVPKLSDHTAQALSSGRRRLSLLTLLLGLAVLILLTG